MKTGSPLAASDREVIDRILNYLAEAEQPLPTSLELYQRILIAQRLFTASDLSGMKTKVEARAKQRLVHGKPIVTFKDLAIKWTDIRELFKDITSLTEEYLSPTIQETRELHDISENAELFKETLRTWFVTGTKYTKSSAKNAEYSQLTSSVIQAAMMPVLSEHAHILLPRVTQDHWYKRYCPICGG